MVAYMVHHNSAFRTHKILRISHMLPYGSTGGRGRVRAPPPPKVRRRWCSTPPRSTPTRRSSSSAGSASGRSARRRQCPARGWPARGGDHRQESSEKGVRLAQNTQVGPCIPVRIQLKRAEVGPTSGPTWRLSHLGSGRVSTSEIDAPNMFANLV